MKRLQNLFCWVMALVLFLSAIGRAAPLDTRVPGNAIIYVGWAGSDALQPQYANSNLKGIIDASVIKQFITEQLPKLMAQAAANDPQAPEIFAKMQNGLDVAWKHPTAFYFRPLDFSPLPQPPLVQFGLVCDAGADGKALIDLVNEALAKSPPPPELPVAVAQEGTLVTISFGKPLTAAQKAANLAATPAYMKAMNNVKQATPAIAAYVDAAAILGMFNEALAKAPNTPPEVQKKAAAVIDAMGIKALTQAAMSSGFDGKGWSDQTFVGVNGPRTGLLSLLGGEPLADGFLASIPKEAASFSAFHLDLHKVFTEIRSIVAKTDDQVLAQFDATVAQGGAMIGMDIEKDILAPLGDQWLFYRAPLSDTGGLSFAVVTKLKDGDTFAKTLASAEQFINTMAAGKFKIDKMTVSKIEVSSVTFLQYSLAWTVRNGTFYMSSIDGIGGAVKQAENKGPSIAESDLFKAAMATMPKGVKPVAIAYSNPAKIYPELRRTLLGLLPLARAAGVDVPAELLPDTEDVAKFMTPGVNMAWWDADGLHQLGRSAFPGAEALSGQSGGPAMVVGVAALGTGILMPSLGKSRELANRSVDAASLRGIAQSCLIYAADNSDKLPDNLAQLIVRGDISPKQLVSKRTGTQPLVYTAELQQLAKDNFPAFARQVAEHCDFVYLGQGTTSSMDASIVVVYEKPGPQTRDGMNMAFQDSHAEWARINGIEAQFGPTNEMLKKKGLPPVDVEAILKKLTGQLASPAAANTDLP